VTPSAIVQRPQTPTLLDLLDTTAKELEFLNSPSWLSPDETIPYTANPHIPIGQLSLSFGGATASSFGGATASSFGGQSPSSFVTRFWENDPNRTSIKIKLTPPMDSFTIILLVQTLSIT